VPGRAREPEDGDRERALRFVVNSLGAKAQSVAEIERKLAARSISPDVMDGVVAEAKRLRYLDDAELAGQLARGLRERRYGRRRAAAALRRRGLRPEDAEPALDAAFEDADEASLAFAALGSRSLADGKAERRAVAYLVRRGFSTGAAWSAVRRAAGDR
jgi:SOS response regulatory protein OraA/RecX